MVNKERSFITKCGEENSLIQSIIGCIKSKLVRELSDINSHYWNWWTKLGPNLATLTQNIPKYYFHSWSWRTKIVTKFSYSVPNLPPVSCKKVFSNWFFKTFFQRQKPLMSLSGKWPQRNPNLKKNLMKSLGRTWQTRTGSRSDFLLNDFIIK